MKTKLALSPCGSLFVGAGRAALALRVHFPSVFPFSSQPEKTTTMKTYLRQLQNFCMISLPAVLSFICLRAEAADFTVTSLGDNNAVGTLRRAVSDAELSPDVVCNIYFNVPVALLPGVISLNPANGVPGENGQMDINNHVMAVIKTLNIFGPGATNLTIFNPGGRIFYVNGGTTVISNLTFTGTVSGADGANGTQISNSGSPGSLAKGGAILQEIHNTKLYFYNCSFQACQAKGGKGGNAYAPVSGPPANGGAGGDAIGGAICNGGPLIPAGDLFLNNCTFSGNSALGGNGGTGYSSGGGGNGGDVLGGALTDMYANTDVVIVNSTFAGNNAYGGQGGTGGAAVGGDTTGGPGGNGGDARGGGIYVFQGCPDPDCTGFIHTTVSQNTSIRGNGGAGGAGPAAAGTPGTAGTAYGGGLYFNVMNPGTLPINNTIIANNFNQPSGVIGTGPDVWGVFASGGYNLIGNNEASTGWFTTAHNPPDLTGLPTSALDPKLGPLQNNGGQVLTMAPLACSPAIDFGTTAGLPFDEIGQNRPKVVSSAPVAGTGCDVGAFELQNYPAGPAVALNIQHVGNSVVISWPASSCYVLQQSPTLNPPNWVYSAASTTMGMIQQVTISPGSCSVASVNSILDSLSEAKASVASRAELRESRMRPRW